MADLETETIASRDASGADLRYELKLPLEPPYVEDIAAEERVVSLAKCGRGSEPTSGPAT